jgi:hypothetical protein
LSFKSATSAELSESAGNDESFKSIEIKNENDLIEEEEQSMGHNFAINSANSPSQHSHSPKLLIAKEIRYMCNLGPLFPHKGKSAGVL